MSGQCKHCGYDGCVCDDKELQRELTYVTKQLTKAHETIGTMIDQIGMLQLKDASTTEQRDVARRLAEKYRNLSCDSQEEADETLLPWEITTPNEL